MEFLDAETGRQKSSLKCATAHRDKNPGSEWPENPVETPYLVSYRKRAVCKDWMVVCAVRYEPVSLLFAKKQGDFRRKQREDCRKYEIGPETRHFSLFQSTREQGGTGSAALQEQGAEFAVSGRKANSH